MDTLLTQEELIFKPLSGVFDVEQVAAAIEPIGFSYRDEAVPNVFLIFMDADSRQAGKARRLADPASPLPYVLLIDVKPHEIAINQFAGPAFSPYSRTFIEWLCGQYACSVSNEEGTDLPAHWGAAK